MSIHRYRNDNPRTADEVADAIEAALKQVDSNIPVIRGTQNYAYVQSFATTLAEQQEESLNSLYDAAYITDASGIELTKRAREIGVQRQDAVAATGVVEFSRDSPATSTYTIPSGTLVGTGGDDTVRFETTQKATINDGYTDTDTTEYTTTNTSYTEKTSFTVDVTFRNSLDVSADIKNGNSSYTTELRVRHDEAGVTVDSYSTSNTSYTGVGPTTYDVSGYEGDITISFELRTTNSSGTAYLDNSTVSPAGELGAETNIVCTNTGASGNVGTGTITVIVNSLAGVDSVTNPQPVGDPSYTLINDTTLQRAGQDRESDASLRERALESSAIGGAGTAEAVELALENIEEVISADVFTNRSDSTVNNVDPWHTEVSVYGGNANDIARRLYEVLPLGTLKTLDGGSNGTLVTVTLEESDLYGSLDIELTRPTEIGLNITIDLVHDATYSGTADVKNAIVNYIGGTTTDARTLPGLGQDENVIVNEVENVAEDVRGVDAVTSSLIDADGDGTDDTTTDGDGVQVYAVGASEVATVDAANITVNETAR